MEMLQEIGSYAGFAAVLGLAVLSALYFSQARDVKRLREWAGRAPERAPAPVEQRRVVAQPVPKPPQPAGAHQPPVPRPPGAQPTAVPQPAVAQSAAGAAPAVATGPAAATPAAAAQAAGASPATDEEAGSDTEGDALDAAVSGDADGEAAEAPAGSGQEPGTSGLDGSGDESDEGSADEDSAPDGEGTGPDDEVTASDDEEHAEAAGAERDEDPSAEWPAVVHQETDEWNPIESGEWRPEDEHSDFGVGEEPRRRELRPPAPPKPYSPAASRPRVPTRGAHGAGAAGRRPILPPYSQSGPKAQPSRGNGDARRTALTVGGVVLALAIAVFAVVQVTGDEEATSPLQSGSQNPPADGGDDAAPAPIDPSSVTVAVLNGTLVPGLAAQMGDKLRAQDFQVGTVTNNFDQERAESVVLYAPGAEREAADVGRRLDISQREEIDPDSQALAGDASVVVVTGADLTQ